MSEKKNKQKIKMPFEFLGFEDDSFACSKTLNVFSSYLLCFGLCSTVVVACFL